MFFGKNVALTKFLSKKCSVRIFCIFHTVCLMLEDSYFLDSFFCQLRAFVNYLVKKIEEFGVTVNWHWKRPPFLFFTSLCTSKEFSFFGIQGKKRREVNFVFFEVIRLYIIVNFKEKILGALDPFILTEGHQTSSWKVSPLMCKNISPQSLWSNECRPNFTKNK